MLITWLLRKYSDVLQQYEDIASGYVFLKRYWSIVRLACINDRAGYVLDAGSGPCNQGFGVLETCGNTAVVCLDISYSILSHGKRLYGSKRAQGIMEFVAGDLRYLPFREFSFNTVLSIAAVHHLRREDLIHTVFEMRRVLKRFGLLIITSWLPWQIRFLGWIIIEYISALFNPLTPKRHVLVPWRRRDRTVLRYYCLHTLKDLLNVIRKLRLRIVSYGVYSPSAKVARPNNYVVAIKE